MSTQTTQGTQDAARRRVLRRRHLLQRQTIIFGSMTVVLVAGGLAALGVFTGVVPAPFDREFTNLDADATSAEFTPCPAGDGLAVALNGVTANVFNGTDRAGLAGSTSGDLAAAGVVIGRQENSPYGPYVGSARIMTGSAGINAAYSVSSIFPVSEIIYDATKTDATIDIILGAGYTSLADPAVAALEPGVPLVARQDCKTPPAATEASV